MTTPTAYLPKSDSKLLMKAIEGMPCMLRISSLHPGHSCSGRDTVVGCHLPVHGKGTSSKVTNLAVAGGCSNCHAILDGVDARFHWIKEHHPFELAMRYLNALVETHARLMEAGIITVKGDTK